MIVAAFFGSADWADPAPIAQAVDELIGTADVDGRQMGVRRSGETAEERARDGALVLVHGAGPGAAELADAEVRRRGFLAVAYPAHPERCDRAGDVPCTCPPGGWLNVDGTRSRRCLAAGRRRNAEIVRYLLNRKASDPAVHVTGRAFGLLADDAADLFERLAGAGIEVTSWA